MLLFDEKKGFIIVKSQILIYCEFMPLSLQQKVYSDMWD